MNIRYQRNHKCVASVKRGSKRVQCGKTGFPFRWERPNKRTIRYAALCGNHTRAVLKSGKAPRPFANAIVRDANPPYHRDTKDGREAWGINKSHVSIRTAIA